MVVNGKGLIYICLKEITLVKYTFMGHWLNEIDVSPMTHEKKWVIGSTVERVPDKNEVEGPTPS